MSKGNRDDPRCRRRRRDRRVACAHALAEADIEVDLVDRNDYHQFQPLLYQVATSQLPVEDVARPLRSIFADLPQVTVHQGEIVALDPDSQTVRLADGSELTGHFLVVSAGARANFFGTDGAAEHSFPLYSVVDAERLRRHLAGVLNSGQAPYDAAVVGGGPTGVEVAGALAELFTALRETGHPGGAATVTLVNHGTELLAPFTRATHEYALRALAEMGVDVRLGLGVTQVAPIGVELSDDSTIHSPTVIWAGGESAAPVVAGLDGLTGRGSRIDVGPDLTVPGHPEVYAIGDAANIPGPDGHALPQLGSVALQSGKQAAHNIARVAARPQGEALRVQGQRHHGDDRARGSRRRDRREPSPRPGCYRIRRVARRACASAQRRAQPGRRLPGVGMGLLRP